MVIEPVYSVFSWLILWHQKSISCTKYGILKYVPMGWVLGLLFQLQVFRRDELQKFLQLVRDSSVKMLDGNVDPLGYDLV